MNSKDTKDIPAPFVTPAMTKNFVHDSRLHGFGTMRILGCLIIYLSSAFFWCGEFTLRSHFAERLLIVVGSAGFALLVLFLKISLIPCKCGKTSEPSWKRSDDFLTQKLRARKTRRLLFFLLVPISLLLLIPLLLIPYTIFVDRLSGEQLLKAYGIILSLSGTLLGLALVFGISSKKVQAYLENARLISEIDFGPEALVDKSPEQLNELIACAMSNGHIAQADLISRHLLSRVEAVDHLEGSQ
ncbi:MAG: hypothetical protein KGS72_01290 [Cyanobacteria bacterium REEB67]|nr:hypothetical protein [Cyanobacteria bacterium REEB67]